MKFSERDDFHVTQVLFRVHELLTIPNLKVGRPLHRRHPWCVPLGLCIWIGFIFLTSSTVIRPQEFFHLVAWFTGAGPEAMQRFTLFWGITWFAFVKGWHVTEFAILTLLTSSALSWWWGGRTISSIVGAMLFCIAFAASDEWHQSFVPYRYGTTQDVVIDCVGICAVGISQMLRLNHGNEAGKSNPCSSKNNSY